MHRMVSRFTICGLFLAAAVALAVTVSLSGRSVAAEARTPAAAVSTGWRPIDPDSGKPYGITKRVPFTSSQVSGSPDPPDPYTLERVFPHIHLDRALDMVLGPGGKRWYVCEHPGMIYSFDVAQDTERAEMFLDIRPKDDRFRAWNEHRDVWSMVFHPKFRENGYVYVCYRDPKPQPARCRISRFQVDLKKMSTPPTCDGDTETLIFEWPTPVDHHGGCLKFGKDGYLYCSAGDGGPIADYFETGQDISDINASIIRIDVDHQFKARPYAVPKDNPFVALPGARPEVYAYGLRNVWKMSFDRKNGDLWAADVGQDLWESIYRVESGGNYGWSVNEGSHPFHAEAKVGPTPILPPVFEHNHAEARSITGGYVYRGTAFPDLVGAYVYGDYETGKIWGLRYDAEQKKVTWHAQLADTSNHIVCFAEDAGGELYVLDYNGTVNRLVATPPVDPTQPKKDFPRLLSKTGLFTSTKNMTPAPGMIPYGVNSPLWSDGALKERYIALPGDSQIEFDANDGWQLPKGAIAVKTFSLEMVKGDRSTAKRLETRLLENEHGHWRGYTYLWNDEQTDAVLLEQQGLDKTYTVTDADAPGGKREQTWHYPSRSECVLCHTMPAHFTLGLNTAQMNRNFNYSGTTDNQLRTLDHLGVFTKPLAEYYKPDPDAPAKEKEKEVKLASLPDPHDATVSLDARARSYLQANCAHCHMRWGGGNAAFELKYPLLLGETGTVNTPPMHGDYGIKNAVVLAPGQPERSLLLYRMAKTGQGRMPHVGSNVVDADAVELIRKWIVELGNPPKN